MAMDLNMKQRTNDGTCNDVPNDGWDINSFECYIENRRNCYSGDNDQDEMLHKYQQEGLEIICLTATHHDAAFEFH